jgi:hypothetical protein
VRREQHHDAHVVEVLEARLRGGGVANRTVLRRNVSRSQHSRLRHSSAASLWRGVWNLCRRPRGVCGEKIFALHARRRGFSIVRRVRRSCESLFSTRRSSFVRRRVVRVLVLCAAAVVVRSSSRRESPRSLRGGGRRSFVVAS